MNAALRVVAFVERVATRDRIRGYLTMLGVVFVAIGIANYALGEGMLDAFGNAIGGDFLAFYTGARLLAEGTLADAYASGPGFSFPAQMAFQRELAAPQELPGVHPFVNPPHAALLYRPFTRFGYGPGVALWLGFGLAALGLAVHRLRRALPGLQRWSGARIFAATFLFVPTMAWVGYGQASAFTLWIYTETFVALRRGRDVWAGACLALLAFKPQLAIAPAVALLVCGRWRAVLAGAACGAGWLALNLALDPEAARAYLALAPQLPQLIRVEGYPTYGVHSLLGFSALLFDPTSPRFAERLATVLTLGALGLLIASWWGRDWRPGTEAWDLRWAGTFGLGLVVSPHLYAYDLMLLLLPFGVLMAHRRAGPDVLPLGGGPLLAWTVALWAACSLGTQLSLVQAWFTQALGVGPRALQLTTLAVAGWSLALLGQAERVQVPREGRTVAHEPAPLPQIGAK